jgi:hypothetical protein
MYAIYILISRNRILWLCLPVCIYTVVTLWSLHGDLPAIDYNDKADWRQPIVSSALFPTPISAQQWHFDYGATEQILTRVKHSGKEPSNDKDQAHLLLNPGLAGVLTKAVDSLPSNMDDKALQRTAFLVLKGQPGLVGKQLASVLINYYQLQHASKIAASSDNSKLALTDQLSILQAKFLATQARQNHYLGTHVATQLFGKKRNITRYLLERRAIKENSNLSQQQRQMQLHKLQSPVNSKIKMNPGLENG